MCCDVMEAHPNLLCTRSIKLVHHGLIQPALAPRGCSSCITVNTHEDSYDSSFVVAMCIYGVQGRFVNLTISITSSTCVLWKNNFASTSAALGVYGSPFSDIAFTDNTIACGGTPFTSSNLSCASSNTPQCTVVSHAVCQHAWSKLCMYCKRCYTPIMMLCSLSLSVALDEVRSLW